MLSFSCPITFFLFNISLRDSNTDYKIYVNILVCAVLQKKTEVMNINIL